MPRLLPALSSLILLGLVSVATASARPLRLNETSSSHAVAPRTTLAAASLNDPLYPQQWGFSATDAVSAWEVTTGSVGVVVAVVDTGVDASHPDLAGKVLPGWNVVMNDSDTSDDNGHGTAVAGIIAAHTANGTGVASYCWRCSILPVKVLGRNGQGSDDDVAAGIVWAADHGARIINVSLGSFRDSPALRNAVTHAVDEGSLVVAAAGNAGSTLPEYPAADPSAVAVAGSSADGTLYPWSSYGAWVDLAAPGSNVTTAEDGSYERFVGTSSAAPVVSGIAALAASVAPTATPAELEAVLESGARPLDGAAFGVVDAASVVAAAQATAGRRAVDASRRSARKLLQ